MKIGSSLISGARANGRTERDARSTPPTSGLEFPQDGVDLARNGRPVVLLHGTLVDKEGIAAYRDFALEHGHPVDHRTYPSITKGERIEKSADLASRNINLARQDIAERNLEKLQGADSAALDEFFALDGGLYGRQDKDAKTVRAALPGLLDEVSEALRQPDLEQTLSGRLKRIENDLEGSLASAGLNPLKADKTAAELLDSIAPKAIVIGHSAGGYVGYALTVNPEVTPDSDPFTFDGGNGVGEMLVLSSPVGQGLATPAPPGVLDLGFYNFDKTFIRPFEQLPPASWMLANPIVSANYKALKNLTKQAYHAANWVSIGLLNPAVHQVRPGNKQVEENSEFFNSYLKDKKVPDGVSVIAVTSPLDMLSEEARSKVDDSQSNAHNFSADLKVSQADVERERPTWAHIIMTEKPDLFKEQYAEHLADPAALAKVLDPSNDDGVRHEALRMLQGQVANGQTELTAQLRKTLKTVASERAPFKDSPSYLAHQILKGL